MILDCSIYQSPWFAHYSVNTFRLYISVEQNLTDCLEEVKYWTLKNNNSANQKISLYYRSMVPDIPIYLCITEVIIWQTLYSWWLVILFAFVLGSLAFNILLWLNALKILSLYSIYITQAATRFITTRFRSLVSIL